MENLNEKPKPKPQQNSKNPQEVEETATTFTCQICIEPVTQPNKKFNNNNTCVHPFCTDCMTKYIQVKLQDNISDIKCPAMACNHSLEPLSCHPILPHQVFNKWCDVLCESTVLGFARVYCPNRKCLELILNECGDDGKRCMCPDCREPFCFGCKGPWHDGSTCEQNGVEMMDENDVAFDAACKKYNWRRCPECLRCIELVDGCNIVQCRCGITFCYKCGKRRCFHDYLHQPNGQDVALCFIGVVLFFCFLILPFIINGSI